VAAGWPAAHVAEQFGISRATASKWVRGHRAEGDRGLEDRSSRPRRSPRRLNPAAEAEILAARATWRYGPDRLGPLLGGPPSTVHRVLVRHGLSRLGDADKVTTAPIRYVACHPGALLHQDHKKLGRIPDGGGWRALGRGGGTKRGHGRIGYDHLEVVIDDTSRYAVVVPVPDEPGASAVAALETAALERRRRLPGEGRSPDPLADRRARCDSARVAECIIRDLGLRTVIDLRWPHELKEAPSVFARSSGVRYLSIPLLEDDPTPVIGLAATYRQMLDERAPQLADVTRALLEPEGLPAVIGCAAGKDRTGVTIALLLSAVGVPADVIVADYVLTSVAFAEPDRDDPHLVDWRASPVELECPPAYMEAMLQHLAVRHGGAGDLLRRNGLAPADLDLLVERLTEPAPD
jgi:hypothetical protein